MCFDMNVVAQEAESEVLEAELKAEEAELNAEGAEAELTAEEAEAKAKADSIDRVAMDEDFIKVSLVFAEPSEVIYSMAGHALLRLQSPSNGLDICYTFAMGESTMDVVRFLSGKSLATYVFSPTEKYLRQYAEEGREVKEVTLNLAPRQEQALWRYLDEQMMGDVMYRYDYLHTNCSSMTLKAIDLALGRETIVYNDLPEGLSGKYGNFRHLLSDLVAQSPWLRMFWNITLGDYIDHDCSLESMLLPAYLWQAWQNASIKDEQGQFRPMTIGEPRVLLESKLHKHPIPFTPDIAGVIIFLVALIVTIVEWRRHWQSSLPGNVVDISLMTIQTVIALWVMYLPVLMASDYNNWNWMMLVFNPLPLILWLTVRKKKIWRYVCMLMCIVPLVFVANFNTFPQMDFYSIFLHMLFISFSLRAFCHTRRLKAETKSLKD